MAENYERPFIARHPIKTMIVASIVLAVIGVVLVFTVVGSIVGLPLLVVSLLLALGAWMKHRSYTKHA